jgi:hypothetical protein
VILAGRYELERRLGGGGMAEVFLARLVGKEGFSRRVAIKRVLAHLATDEAFAKMFVAEAQMCARLVHPNIVSVLDFDRDEEGRPFLVIELVDGPSLAELGDGGALPVGAALHLACELLRGLAYAHDLPGDGDVRGVVHRDISPHNVLLSWEGAVKVSDFGIAKARAASGVTASELLKGKPAYMSPEQANGEALDGRSDLFAVGVVLWEMLVGRSLFAGHTTQETLARVLFAPIPSPRSIRPELPADVDAVVMKLLAREKHDRYASADDAIAALVACKDHPRDGREQLVALLADRFADDAPQRRRMLADVPTVRTPAEYAPTLPAPRDGTQWRKHRRLVVGAIALAAIAAISLVIAARSFTEDVVTPRAIDAAVAIDAGPNDPELVAERAKWMVAAKATKRASLPFPPPDEKAVEPIAYYEQIRSEIRRLFGYEAEVVTFSFSGIGANGRVDASMMGHGVTVVFRIRPSTSDGIHCVEVSSHSKDQPRFKMMLVTNEAWCQDFLWRQAGPPRCTGSQIYERAIALGYPKIEGRLSAELRSNRWLLTETSLGGGRSDEMFEASVPNDCH